MISRRRSASERRFLSLIDCVEASLTAKWTQALLISSCFPKFLHGCAGRCPRHDRAGGRADRSTHDARHTASNESVAERVLLDRRIDLFEALTLCEPRRR